MTQNFRQPDERASIKTILLVEDNVHISEVLVQAITQETSFSVMHVSNGLEALSAIDGMKPDLFVFDYQLPYMNGIELFDRLHASNEFADIPTIIMSAHLPYQEIARRNVLAMSKPIDLDAFLQAIEDLLL